MISANLSGKTALVTGGASGIGLAVTKTLLRNGATVAVNHLPDDAAGAAVVADLIAAGEAVVAAPGDVSQPEAARAMTETAIERLGGLDFLINNAGASGTREPIPFPQLDAVSDELGGWCSQPT